MADFNFDAHRVEPGTPVWNVVSTDMEGMKVKTRLKSTRSMNSWTLYFRGQTNAERLALLAHYNGQYGPNEPFYWTSVPDHIGSISYYVRYSRTGTPYKEVPVLFNIWEITVVFEEALS